MLESTNDLHRTMNETELTKTPTSLNREQRSIEIEDSGQSYQTIRIQELLDKNESIIEEFKSQIPMMMPKSTFEI